MVNLTPETQLERTHDAHTIPTTHYHSLTHTHMRKRRTRVIEPINSVVQHRVYCFSNLLSIRLYYISAYTFAQTLYLIIVHNSSDFIATTIGDTDDTHMWRRC